MAGVVVGTFCRIFAGTQFACFTGTRVQILTLAPNSILGDQLCVVPYLRAVACDKEYRRYPVVDNDGQSWEELGRYFSCNPVWMTSRLVDKCCHSPRCACCTKDGTTEGEATKGTHFTCFTGTKVEILTQLRQGDATPTPCPSPPVFAPPPCLPARQTAPVRLALLPSKPKI